MGKKKRRSQLRKLQILLKKGKIHPMLWLVHFGNAPANVVPTCQDCCDFQIGACSGGCDPLKCMVEASKNAVIEFFGALDD